jgi:5-methylcytosine-specific restriction protein B
MAVKDLAGLKSAFQNKIIPLLQEYFYGDFGKIGLVLGQGFVQEQVYENTNTVFADFAYETSLFDDKRTYRLIDYTAQPGSFELQVGKEKEQVDFLRAVQVLLK